MKVVSFSIGSLECAVFWHSATSPVPAKRAVKRKPRAKVQPAVPSPSSPLTEEQQALLEGPSEEPTLPFTALGGVSGGPSLRLMTQVEEEGFGRGYA